MNNYFLVIDTETSGLPKRWDVAYDVAHNWPFVVQIAWIIFDSLGAEIKRENHYLKNIDFKIPQSAIKIHQITPEYLALNGKHREEVMLKLQADLLKYEPLIIGHFVELDYHMVNAEFFRANINQSLKDFSLFCTMHASVPYIKNPSFYFLKLNIFYQTLFNKKVAQAHNAIIDAELTAEIFFHLKAKAEVSDEIIQKQQSILKKEAIKVRFPWILPILIIGLMMLLICLWYAR